MTRMVTNASSCKLIGSPRLVMVVLYKRAGIEAGIEARFHFKLTPGYRIAASCVVRI